MATFYVLPSRRYLGQRFGAFLGDLLPGLRWNGDAWSELAEALGATASRQPQVYVVFREDLLDAEDLAVALAREFGAERGDEVIEIARCPCDAAPPFRIAG